MPDTCTWYSVDTQTQTGPGDWVPYDGFAAALASTAGYQDAGVLWGSADANWNDDGSGPYVVIYQNDPGANLWGYYIGLTGTPGPVAHAVNFISALAALDAVQQSDTIPPGFCVESTAPTPPPTPAGPCDPAALVKAAACFSCIPKGMLLQAMIAALCPADLAYSPICQYTERVQVSDNIIKWAADNGFIVGVNTWQGGFSPANGSVDKKFWVIQSIFGLQEGASIIVIEQTCTGSLGDNVVGSVIQFGYYHILGNQYFFTARRPSLYGIYLDGTQPGDGTRPAGLTGPLIVKCWPGMYSVQFDAASIAWVNGVYGDNWDGIARSREPILVGYYPEGAYGATVYAAGHEPPAPIVIIHMQVGLANSDAPNFGQFTLTIQDAAGGPPAWTLNYTFSTADPFGIRPSGSYVFSSFAGTPPPSYPASIDITEIVPPDCCAPIPCPPGYAWDQASCSCVHLPCPDGTVWNPVTLVCDPIPCPPLAASPLPDATNGSAYSQALYAGVDPFTFVLHTGSVLPTGLTLHSNGLIDGTPTVDGAVSFTVDVKSNTAVICSPVYSITVNAAPQTGYETSLLAYYQCDTPGHSSLVDSTGAHDIPPNGSGNVRIVAGFIGDGIAFGDNTHPTFKLLNGSFVNFSGQDFCVRLWVYLDVTTWNNTYISASSWYIDHNSANTVRFHIDGDPSGSYTIISPSLTGNEWHRVIVWHKSGVEIGMKIDDSAPIAPVAAPNIMFSDNGQVIFSDIDSDLDHDSFDEIAIWAGYILTSADMTLDWNGGAGQTYPLP